MDFGFSFHRGCCSFFVWCSLEKFNTLLNVDGVSTRFFPALCPFLRVAHQASWREMSPGRRDLSSFCCPRGPVAIGF